MSLSNICAAHSNGKKTYGSQNGEAAAHIVRYHELLISLLVSQVL